MMSNNVKSFIVSSIFFMLGCSDYDLIEKIEEIPDINVSPMSVNYNSLHAGIETKTEIVTVENVGNGVLTIQDIFLSDSSIFSFTSIHNQTLDPGTSLEIAVTYDPTTMSIDNEILTIESDDPNEKEVYVMLFGEGAAPIIDIDPIEYDFNNVDVGCDSTMPILISNIGDVDLIITQLDYFVSFPSDFFIDEQIDINGELPWTVLPGAYAEVLVDYIPTDLYDDESFLDVLSNDPQTPTETADQFGQGKYYDIVTDTFEQDEVMDADILFVIDNSCSMSSHQTNLINNFDSFINVFVSSGVNYQLAFITTDSENFVENAIVKSTDADPVSDVNRIIGGIGISGSGLERGLYESWQATQSGGDAGPGSDFLRNNARLVIIYVSDERDWSLYYSTMEPADYVSHIKTLKGSLEHISVNAVAGDHPGGCSGNGYAQFGDGYYDVVTDLGGTFMSICTTSWGSQLDQIAKDSIAINGFGLSDLPIEDTIIVTVNNALVTQWSYDAVNNLVSFNNPPAEGDQISIEYAIYGICEPE